LTGTGLGDYLNGRGQVGGVIDKEFLVLEFLCLHPQDPASHWFQKR